jgi:filamentous hemagglutinin family protein
MSYHTFSTKPLNASLKALLKRGGHVGLGIAAFTPVLALANPSGGHVVAGSATIKNTGANTTVVKQNSRSAVIDWQQFNIGNGQYVQFLQPSSSSIILNRVVGGGGSSIFGSLSGNGQVFLINTNGIVVGAGARIDTAGFIASTLNITDSDFLQGRLRFEGGGAGKLSNAGTIRASGDIMLVGHFPHLPQLLALLRGRDELSVDFPKHGVVALATDDEGDTWRELWQVVA